MSVTIYATTPFRNKYGTLPPPPGTKSDERVKFEALVARQFLANHGQQIAAANSVGSNGLKNVDEVYGTSICDKIRELAKDKSTYPEFNGGIIDPIEQTKRSAGYNKPEPEVSTGKPYKGLQEKPGFLQKVKKAVSFLSRNPVVKGAYWVAAVALTVFVPPAGIAMLAVGAIVEGPAFLSKLGAAATMSGGRKTSHAPLVPKREQPSTLEADNRKIGVGVDYALDDTYGHDLEQSRSAPSTVNAGLPKVSVSRTPRPSLAEIRNRDSAEIRDRDPDVAPDLPIKASSAPANRGGGGSSLRGG